MLVAGLVTGCVLGVVPGVVGLVGLAGRWAATGVLAADAAGALLLFQWARRRRMRGFPQGLVIGLSIMLLLLAACWGTALVSGAIPPRF